MTTSPGDPTVQIDRTECPTLSLRVPVAPVAPPAAQKTPQRHRVPSWAQEPQETPRGAVAGWLADTLAVALGVFLGATLAVAVCTVAFVVWFA